MIPDTINETKTIVETAQKFTSSIVIETEDKMLDVKSILGIFVSLYKNKQYKLHVTGPDEEEAKKELLELFKTFGYKVTV